MHTAVVIVLCQVLILTHVRRLPQVATRYVTVVRVLQITHGARRVVLQVDDILAQQPVVAVNHGTKNVCEGLVQSALLKAILQVHRALNDAVGHFVRGDIQRSRQGAEGFAAVTIGHEHAIPVGILHGLVAVGDMDQRNHRAAVTVDTQATVGSGEVVIHLRHIGVGGDRCGVFEDIVGTGDVGYVFHIRRTRIQRPECPFGVAQAVGVQCKGRSGAIDKMEQTIGLEGM